MAEPAKSTAMAHLDVWHATGDRFLIDVRGHDLLVDQPLDAGGGDVGPTPTELFVASLAACVGFYAGRFLRRHELPVEGLGVSADFGMSTSGPARVTTIELRVSVPVALPEARRDALMAVVRHCTVHNSLREVPEVRVELDAPEERAA